MLFLFLREILLRKNLSSCASGHEKTRWLQLPAGFGVSLDLSGRLLQAMAVRRHLGPVMVVMTEMAAILHLFQT
jgi:hypothetical protein